MAWRLKQKNPKKDPTVAFSARTLLLRGSDGLFFKAIQHHLTVSERQDVVLSVLRLTHK